MGNAARDLITPDVPESDTQRLFAEPPWHLVSPFKAHVSKTGQPETFKGLHQGPLPKDAAFRVLTRFDVDRSKRPDGKKAPCPMCRSADKFLHNGCLVYFDSEGFVAAIGPECADKDKMRLAMAEYDARMQAQAEEDYLIDRLPMVSKRLRALEALVPTCAEAARIHRAIKSKAPKAKAQITRAIKLGGLLTVEEETERSLRGIGPSGLGSSNHLRTVNFGTVSGQTIKLGKFEPDNKLTHIILTLRCYPHWWTDERAFNQVANCDAEWRHEAYLLLRNAEEKYDRLRSEMVDFRAFFTSANVGRISNWCSHPAHPAPFQISLKRHRDPDGLLFEVVGPERDHARVLIKPHLVDQTFPAKLFP